MHSNPLGRAFLMSLIFLGQVLALVVQRGGEGGEGVLWVSGLFVSSPGDSDKQRGLGIKASMPPPFSWHRKQSRVEGTLGSQGRDWPRGLQQSRRLRGITLFTPLQAVESRQTIVPYGHASKFQVEGTLQNSVFTETCEKPQRLVQMLRACAPRGFLHR